MGYFSALDAEDRPLYEDHSYPPPEQQLQWRLEELEETLEELREKRKRYEDRVTFSENQLRYVLPRHFSTVADVKAAIELAVCELKERYGIRMRAEEEEMPVFEEVTGTQISIWELMADATLYAA